MLYLSLYIYIYIYIYTDTFLDDQLPLLQPPELPEARQLQEVAMPGRLVLHIELHDLANDNNKNNNHNNSKSSNSHNQIIMIIITIITIIMYKSKSKNVDLAQLDRLVHGHAAPELHGDEGPPVARGRAQLRSDELHVPGYNMIYQTRLD